MCIQDLLRHQTLFKESGMTFRQIIDQMDKGIQGYKTLLPYKDNGRNIEKNMLGGVTYTDIRFEYLFALPFSKGAVCV